LEIHPEDLFRRGDTIMVSWIRFPGVYLKDSKNMSELPDKSIHLIVTGSPYYVGIDLTDRIIWVKSTNSHSRDVSKIFSDKIPPPAIESLSRMILFTSIARKASGTSPARKSHLIDKCLIKIL
jgi:hypothetical protein